MFNKLKQVKDLRSQAKQMQNVLSQESVTTEQNGMRMVMDGNMEVKDFTVAENVSREAVIQLVPEVVNDSIKSVQRIMAKKMQEMGGIPGFNS